MIIEGRYLDEILRELYGKLTESTDTFEASKGKGLILNSFRHYYHLSRACPEP